MNQQPLGRRITKNESIDPSGSRIRVTKLQQDIDDTHVVIESTVSTLDNNGYIRPTISRENAKYYIEIDDGEGPGIDVTLNLGTTPLIRSNRRYPAPIQNTNKSARQNQEASHSRIQVQSRHTQPYKYEINYKVEDDDTANSGMKNYHTCITETSHIIKIRGSHHSGHISNYYSGPERNFNIQNQVIPRREQKTFGEHNAEGKGRQGKIIRNGESNKNIGMPNLATSREQNQQKNNWMQKQAQESRSQPMPLIKLMQSQQGNKNSMEPKTQVDRNYGQSDNKKPFEIGKQIRTEPRTPKNTNYRQDSGSMSPIVRDYGTSSEVNISAEHDPIFIDDKYNSGRPRIFNQRNKNAVVSQFQNFGSDQEERDKQRIPPAPIMKKPTLEKNLQKQLTNNEWPPSIKDIPLTSSTNRNANKPRREREQERKKNDSPIRVPIEKLPNSYKARHSTQMNGSDPRQEVKHVKISLTKPHKHKNTEEQTKNDVFVVNKNKYLDKLRRSQRSRSRLDHSRTFSRTSRHSLSPQCQKVTNRLHKTRINKQPCPRYEHYQQQMKKMEMKETLGQYSFIRRYLTDHEIWQILTQFEMEGVPEKKWPIRLVDVVYDKLRAMKIY